jgi:exoribonuclease R
MTLYKIKIANRNYDSWQVFNSSTNEQIVIDDLNPINHKLLNNDVFIYNKGKVEILKSNIRTNETITAVLILDNNKTYGRENKNSGKEGKLLYKCIPNDPSIPIFLVPYEIKQMGFSKVFNNLYVTLRFNHWLEKHPHAYLTQTIGPVDDIENFYEYQLFCKNLNISFQLFNKATNNTIKKNAHIHDSFITDIYKKYPTIEDRTSWKTFTIDPSGSQDFDDGFSIKSLGSNGQKTLLSIYIANVSIWLDCLNLWPAFSERISTIYLPNRKIPMLPNILSDCLCSLQSNARRFAFTMDIILDNDYNIISINYANCLIKVLKNFCYEEPALLNDSDYIHLLQSTTNLSSKYKYVNYIHDSHDIVSYLMIFMNHHCAKELLKNKNGIFRSVSNKDKHFLPPSLPNDVSQFLKIFSSTSGQYITLENCHQEDLLHLCRHETLELDAYVHITSPIRRIVDLLNMIQFQINNQLINLSYEAIYFYSNWISKIDYINTTMRSIRQVQNDCNLLHMCFNNDSVIDKIYDGYCFDKSITTNNLFHYMVFLPELRISSRIIINQDFDNYTQHKFKLFLFNDEEKFKKKIRLQLIV